MRLLLLSAVLLTAACGPGLVLDEGRNMTPEQMFARADHVFVGVIQKERYEHWPFLQIPGQSSKNWIVDRRDVRVEMVLRGSEPRPDVAIYEYATTLGTSGDWNSTREGERDLFFVRLENGRYHVVRDYFRCIFRIYSGKHDRLPMDDSHSLWERVSLLNWWPGDGRDYGDPNRMLLGRFPGMWRAAKLARGFVRNPERETRVLGCQVLLLMGRWQDECWSQLSQEDRATWSAHGLIPAERLIQVDEQHAMDQWDWAVASNEVDMMRLLTTASHPVLRRQFCRLFEQRYPNDHDNGCPANRPPPATIVTKDGDIPLIGTWPQVRQ